MSRFHRDTFRPPNPDLKKPAAPRARKSGGKRSGHAPPPWAAESQPVPGLADASAPIARLARALRAAGKAAAARRDGSARRRIRGT